MLSDQWLSRYGLLENYTAEVLNFGGVLDFDLTPWHGPWGPVLWNES